MNSGHPTWAGCAGGCGRELSVDGRKYPFGYFESRLMEVAAPSTWEAEWWTEKTLLRGSLTRAYRGTYSS